MKKLLLWFCKHDFHFNHKHISTIKVEETKFDVTFLSKYHCKTCDKKYVRSKIHEFI